MRAAIAVGAMLITAALMVPPRSVAAQTQGSGNVPTVTRLVKIFLDKEQALGTAIRAGDSTALEGLLTDDFEVREGAQPGTPISVLRDLRRRRVAAEQPRVSAGRGRPSRRSAHRRGLG